MISANAIIALKIDTGTRNEALAVMQRFFFYPKVFP